MSEVTVSEIKAFLRVPHSFDDALLQTLIDAAEDEAARFMNVLAIETPPQPSVKVGIYFLVQRSYENTKPEDADKMRRAAETLLMPYRVGLGV